MFILHGIKRYDEEDVDASHFRFVQLFCLYLCVDSVAVVCVSILSHYSNIPSEFWDILRSFYVWNLFYDAR